MILFPVRFYQLKVDDNSLNSIKKLKIQIKFDEDTYIFYFLKYLIKIASILRALSNNTDRKKKLIQGSDDAEH